MGVALPSGPAPVVCRKARGWDLDSCARDCAVAPCGRGLVSASKKICRVRADAERDPSSGSLRLPPSPAGGEEKGNYTDAVVTPPSTTMVWPVMKLEALEPR